MNGRILWAARKRDLQHRVAPRGRDSKIQRRLAHRLARSPRLNTAPPSATESQNEPRDCNIGYVPQQVPDLIFITPHFRRDSASLHLLLSPYLSAVQLRLAVMEYKGFVVRAFEREKGKWRATIRRPHGLPLKAKDQRRRYHFVTSRDADTATDALLFALVAIDAGLFSRDTVRSTEKFWRRNQQRSASNVGSRST